MSTSIEVIHTPHDFYFTKKQVYIYIEVTHKKPALPSKASSRHFSSQNISVKPHCPSLPSVCTVCVFVSACVCVCVCIFCIIMLEHLSIYIYLFFGITFSISMYIMCVCLFSAFSHRVGALQISIIIIMSGWHITDKRWPMHVHGSMLLYVHRNREAH